MIALIQRVSHSKVVVDDHIVGQIHRGMTVLLGIQKQDTQKDALDLVTKIFNYRIFTDDVGKMNLSLLDLHLQNSAVKQGQGHSSMDKPFEKLDQMAGLRAVENAACFETIGLLIVPQFTLAAATNTGNRPSFSHAAEPQLAKVLYEYFIECAKNLASSPRVNLQGALNSHRIHIQTGIFGADMSVHIVNDGPVTFWLGTQND